MKKSWLNNKTLIISGASSGIGRELSRLLINRHNCHVIGVGRNEEKMLAFVETLGDKKTNFEYFLFDVAIEKNWQDFANKIKDKNIDILINNAGILPSFCNINSMDISDIKSVMNINFMSIVYSTKYILPIIETSNSPALINISSSAGLCPLPGIAVYSASKSAVKNFTECLRLEKNYYVGLVCPGFTKTEIFRYQKYESNNKLIDIVSTDLNKMAKKIYKGIRRQKVRMVYGIDAKWMDRLYRWFPRSSPKFFKGILKSAKVELFKDVFDE